MKTMLLQPYAKDFGTKIGLKLVQYSSKSATF